MKTPQVPALPGMTPLGIKPNPQRLFGLLVRHSVRYGSRYIDVLVCSKEPGADFEAAPLGVSDDSFSYERPKHLADVALDGLGMYGFITDMRNDDGLCGFIGDSIEYRDVFSIDARKAGRMHKLLKRINSALDKAKAYEPGDRFAVLAKLLKLDFVVEDRKDDLPRSGQRWRYMTVAEGRNRYRQMIEEARQKETDRLYPQPVAQREVAR